MPSGETLRFTLVCKLPLLHFTLARVAVVQRLGHLSVNQASSLPLVQVACASLSSRRFRRFPSSSAPAFQSAHLLT